MSSTKVENRSSCNCTPRICFYGVERDTFTSVCFNAKYTRNVFILQLQNAKYSEVIIVVFLKACCCLDIYILRIKFVRDNKIVLYHCHVCNCDLTETLKGKKGRGSQDENFKTWMSVLLFLSLLVHISHPCVTGW